jgi:serine phosphatase RsbU (regulator of sigma subunit)
MISLKLFFLVVFLMLILVLIVLFIAKKKHSQIQKNIQTNINELDLKDKEFLSFKETFAEKQKKIWQTNEYVYKEKKKIEEQLQLITSQQEKLQQEKTKLDDRIKKLWQQSTAIHTEKEKIKQLKLEIEEKHLQISDSIEYAKIIQEAILPDINLIQHIFNKIFIVFWPRDTVSGDFYWFSALPDGSAIIVAADCTGHGVPGAFMSMIGNTMLNEIINEKSIYEPAQILSTLNNNIVVSLKQNIENAQTRDGMDMAICRYIPSERKLIYAGANRPLWKTLKNEENEVVLLEVKPSKFAIGGFVENEQKVFVEHSLMVAATEKIFLFSDGYADQFGGSKGKKFMTLTFQELLKENHFSSIETIEKEVKQRYIEWKGQYKQVDDVLVIGIEF